MELGTRNFNTKMKLSKGSLPKNLFKNIFHIILAQVNNFQTDVNTLFLIMVSRSKKHLPCFIYPSNKTFRKYHINVIKRKLKSFVKIIYKVIYYHG